MRLGGSPFAPTAHPSSRPLHTTRSPPLYPVQDDYEPGTFHFMELYASQAAMAQHNSAEPVRRFVDGLAPHLDGPLGMVLYEYSDGKIGPPSMEVRHEAGE